MTVTPAELAVLSRLLDEVTAVPDGEREEWLVQLPAADQALAPMLRGMLAAQSDASRPDFLCTLPRLDDESVAGDEFATTGDRIGPYRLIREIGRGGMGAVWLAERDDGALQRQVALKLPRLAWGAGLAERMKRERDIGALLEHPHIARLYDAGVDLRGRPYLAFEYIAGQAIDAHCDAHSLGLPQRLRLFNQVARAVAYAHGRLIVHRDLKPSNVLVTDDGQAHLLDFGIAKLLDDAIDATLLTQEQGRVLTPQYASPEQVRGELITVVSDVYSLGVLLCELLTGSLPYKLRRKTLGALEEAILEGEPPLASSRVAEKARAKALHGEIDAIVAKALRREPAQRYQTVDALVDDIDRHLNGERVLAQPDSVGYRFSKAIRRHRVEFGAVAAILLAVLTGAGMAIVQARRATDAAERARVVKEFVVDVFKINERGNPANNELRQLPAELLLEHGAKLIDTKFQGQSELRAELYGVVGGIFSDMGSAKLATDYAVKQLATLTAAHASNGDRASAMLLLADGLYQQDLLSDALQTAQQAVELAAGRPALKVRARVLLARILAGQAQYKEAAIEANQIDRDLRAWARPLPTDLAVAEAKTLWLRAELLGRAQGGVRLSPLWDQAITAAIAAEGPTSRLAAAIRIDYAYSLADEHGAEARQQLAAALVAMRATGGAGDMAAALAQSRVYAQLFDFDFVGFAEAHAAVTESQRILAEQESRVPDAVRASVDFDLGWLYRNWGDVEKGYTLQSKATAVLRKTAEGPFAQRVLDTSLGMDASEVGRHDEADTLLRRGLAMRKLDSANNPGIVAYGYLFVAQNLFMQGRHDEAARELDSAPAQSWFLSPLRAMIKLERGDARGALGVLSTSQSSETRNGDLADVQGAAMCQSDRQQEGLAQLDAYIRRRSTYAYEHDPSLARARAVAGLCALSAGQRGRAAEYAEMARRSFTAQPGVSPYYKGPLAKLEQLLRPG